jgi:5-dehydro-2-deoxygluconokinase
VNNPELTFHWRERYNGPKNLSSASGGWEGSMAASDPQLDVITIGRSSVDLYGQQIGTRLEEIGTFIKAVGGCPSNIAIGTARLGLRSAVITRVGDEQMGRFIREQFSREGVTTTGVKTDPDRLTALVLLAVEDEGVSPMIFYRTDCADMALDESDIDEGFLQSAGAVLISGTHFSTPDAEAAQLKAVRIAKAAGRKVVFDIDYRPNLWGLGGHAAGFERYVKSDYVTGKIQPVLKHCDLIVGTEEEVLIAGGKSELHAALTAIRDLSDATIVLKRGAKGCIVYDGAIPNDLEQGIVGKGFPIEIYNVLGAGDAFMSGFLRGWLKGEPHATSATWANACGAFAVSRLLCAPEYPTWEELSHFLAHGSPKLALRHDETLNRIHRATTRSRKIEKIMALAIDHRLQLEQIAGEAWPRIGAFKALAVEAAARVADGREGFGMLLDDKHGRAALFAAAHQENLWIARPLELPGSRPLRFEFGEDMGSRLLEWPVEHCAKVLCFYHPDDEPALKAAQLRALHAAQDAARGIGRELLVEIIASKHGEMADGTTARVLEELYASELYPDWWKLESQQSTAAWTAIDQVIETHDRWCRGVMLLGLEAPIETLTAAFALAKRARTVRGFAVGRTIFADAAKAWFAGRMSDEQAVEDMAARFRTLCEAWEGA